MEEQRPGDAYLHRVDVLASTSSPPVHRPPPASAADVDGCAPASCCRRRAAGPEACSRRRAPLYGALFVADRAQTICLPSTDRHAAVEAEVEEVETRPGGLEVVLAQKSVVDQVGDHSALTSRLFLCLLDDVGRPRPAHPVP